jgi:stress response protein YsnF
MSTTPNPAQETIKVPISEEVLTVDTRRVDTGRGVRVHKTVHAEPVRIDETLAREEIAVRHVPVDRTLAQDETLPATRYEGDVLIVPVLEEVVVVERRIRLKEELHITRVTREENFSRTVEVRTEEVRIERFDDNTNS